MISAGSADTSAEVVIKDENDTVIASYPINSTDDASFCLLPGQKILITDPNDADTDNGEVTLKIS